MGMFTLRCDALSGASSRLESLPANSSTTPNATWLLWMCQHTRPVETQGAPGIFHVSHWHFWKTISETKWHWSPHQMHQRNVRGYWRLVRQSLLRDQIRLRLQCAHLQHIDAGIHQEALDQVQASHANSAPILPILTIPQTIWCKGTSTPPHWHFPKTFSWQNERNSTHCRQHIVLCPCHEHHCTHGIELNCNWKNKGNNKHNEKKQSNFWITFPQTLTWPYDTAPPTWSWMCIQMHLTCLNQMLTVKRVDIFSWVGLRKMANP